MARKMMAFLTAMVIFMFSMPYLYSGDPPTARLEVKNSERYYLRLKNLRQKEPNNAELSYELGNYHYSIRSYDEAIKEYRRALRVNPEHEYAKWFLSKTLVNKGYYDEAFWLVRELIIKHKKQAELYEYAGEILLKMEEKNVANEYFAKCDELIYKDSNGAKPLKALTKPNRDEWKRYFF